MRDQSVAKLDTGRALHAVGERRERLREVSTPGSEFYLGPGECPRCEDIRVRLNGAVQLRLLDPAAAIAASVALLQDQASPSQAHSLTAIAESAARMDVMLRDLVTFVRFASGAVIALRDRVDLKVVCERVVDAVGSAHPEHAINFVSDRRVIGDWDADAIEVLLSKLIVNAIEHGRESMPVRVEVRAYADSAVVEVWNAGFIADPSVRARLFEPFVSASNPAASGGLGLGLYLAREIAQAHGGRIDAQSHERTGTIFRATLPR